MKDSSGLSTFQVGYNGRESIFRESPQDRWWISFPPVWAQPQSWPAECARSAKILSKNAGGPIGFPYFGNPETLFIAQTFQNAGIDARVVVFQLSGDPNSNVSGCANFCRNAGLQYEVEDFNCEEFLGSSNFVHIAQHTKSSDFLVILRTYFYSRLIEKGLFPITSSSQGHLIHDQDGWCVRFSEQQFGLHRYLKALDLPGISDFRLSTPELMLAFYRWPAVDSLVRNPSIHIGSSQFGYTDFVNTMMPGQPITLDARTCLKLTQLFELKRPLIPKENSSYNDEIKISYTSLMQYLSANEDV